MRPSTSVLLHSIRKLGIGKKIKRGGEKRENWSKSNKLSICCLMIHEQQ